MKESIRAYRILFKAYKNNDIHDGNSCIFSGIYCCEECKFGKDLECSTVYDIREWLIENNSFENTLDFDFADEIVNEFEQEHSGYTMRSEVDISKNTFLIGYAPTEEFDGGSSNEDTPINFLFVRKKYE